MHGCAAVSADARAAAQPPVPPPVTPPSSTLPLLQTQIYCDEIAFADQPSDYRCPQVRKPGPAAAAGSPACLLCEALARPASGRPSCLARPARPVPVLLQCNAPKRRFARFNVETGKIQSSDTTDVSACWPPPAAHAMPAAPSHACCTVHACRRPPSALPLARCSWARLRPWWAACWASACWRTLA